jgi:hypothetical protein
MKHISAIVVAVWVTGTGCHLPNESEPRPDKWDKLTPAEARQGWISLFDGHTTFGWESARLEDGLLTAGTSHVALAEFDVRADITRPGTMIIGGEEYRLRSGRQTFRRSGPTSPIALDGKLALRGLFVRPLGFRSIFNGEDLDGWQRRDKPSIAPENRPVYKVEDGWLRIIGGPGSIEYCRERFDDFVLQIDVRVSVAHGNGGAFFRCVPNVCLAGYEAQIWHPPNVTDPGDPREYTSGALDDRMRARRVISRDFETFTMTVVARGPRIAIWVDGEHLVDWLDERSPNENPRRGLRLEAGTIQLQAHDPETKIDHRNIRVAVLE